MSRRPALEREVLAVADEEQGLRVLSPGVGWWTDPPPTGSRLVPGGRVGELQTLGRRVTLVLPAGAAGTRVDGPSGDRRMAVGYGELLFVLAPDAAGPRPQAAAKRTDPAAIAEGSFAVVAPTDGVFYRQPAPDAPPFVEIGSSVRAGEPVGLVESMKTFNQILYGAPGQPQEAEVVEIRCENGAEVHAGQVLVVVRPSRGAGPAASRSPGDAPI